LWEDGERIFHRTWSVDADGIPCTMLAVLLSHEQPPLLILDHFAHEFDLRGQLDDLWALRPVDLQRDGGRTVLVLKDPGGEALDRQIGEPMEVGHFLRLAVSIATALGKVHQHGLIHKDVKPTNIVVNCADGHARLTGFGLASRLPSERQSPAPPETIAGTLAYMAPEQTGRMNRSIDSRSDLYSLGVTLYQLLTGALPFTASDPAEWVHCHTARTPVPPCAHLETIPGALSAIIVKLLAKSPEERYQTAGGLERDLRHCLSEWEARNSIAGFSLGKYDTPDQLVIPGKLYGRVREAKTLLAAFERIVQGGPPELVLVSGPSGIGKSSVVNEVHWASVTRSGLFASAKFEQSKHDIPYSALVAALHGLIRSLLARHEDELAGWRHGFLEALGPNGQIMVNLLPELSLIIGDQPPCLELEPQQVKRRLQLLFRRFIGVLAQRSHPLVLFLDDLQWVDAATIDLTRDLLCQSDLQYLLLVGACRSDEVDEAHPLLRSLAAIRAAGAVVHELALEPLNQHDLGHFIKDSIHCSFSYASSLTHLVHHKTAGNPFFVIQFLHALREDGLLSFDYSAAAWTWDAARIRGKSHTDNILGLVTDKLNRLPESTRSILGELACLGHVADIATLALVNGRSEADIQVPLQEAIIGGLIALQDDRYVFVHDRFQEAAYAVISEPLRPAVHLHIGRTLLKHTEPNAIGMNIFAIVNQFNRGAPLIESDKEREQVVELNLIAGQRAKASAAYAPALGYLAAGAEMLPEHLWERRHDLMFATELHRAECELLVGEPATAENRLVRLLAHATNSEERRSIACLRMDVYTTADKSSHAVAVGLDYLRELGMDWPLHPKAAEARLEYDRISAELAGRAIEELVDLPAMRDTASLATMEVLTKLLAPAVFTDMNLLTLLVCRAVDLSIREGNSHGSSVAYAQLGIVAGLQFEDYQADFRFGEVAYKLAERGEFTRFQAPAYLIYGAHVMPFTRHVREARPVLRRTFEMANRSADLTFAAYSRSNLNANFLEAGEPLAEVQSEAEDGLAYVRKIRFGFTTDIISAQLGLVRTLRGLTPKFGSLDYADFDESSIEQRFAANPDLWRPECMYWIIKLWARVIAGDYDAAIAALSKLQQRPWTPQLTPGEGAAYYFFGALALAATCGATNVERQQRLDILAVHHHQLLVWAENCPDNFESRAAMVGAEIARLEGRELDAERLYEQAIRSARGNGFPQYEAIAYELAAHFYRARGFNEIAFLYLANARNCYLRWGADGKVRQLDQLFPALSEKGPPSSPMSTVLSSNEHLDLATVVKLSQAISGELVIDTLIETLMRLAIEHAGAERGVLILPRGRGYRVEAEAATSGDMVLVNLQQAEVTGGEVPGSVLDYVTRTKESVLLHDASGRNPFSDDEYIRHNRTLSILCLPLLKQARLIGILYLENNLTRDVFTPTRITVLKLLVSEAAISLENTRLYSELQEREAGIRQLQMELAHANRVATMGQLTASIAHEVNQPLVAVLSNARAALHFLDTLPPNIQEAREALSDIVKDGSRAGEILRRIHALVKKSLSRKDDVDLNEAIVDITALTRSEAMKCGISLQTQLTEDLPSVKGDRVQLQQVILNLIVNAIEATSAVGTSSRELRISTARCEPDHVLVGVRDSGAGIHSRDLERVFEAFYSTKSAGLGMGLSICRSIVETHGGRIWATANATRGAMFQFTLPVGAGQS